VQTRFYCENCGKDVPFNAEICPTCGKAFSAVKCPVCLFEGKPGAFLQGCPKCGYMSPQIDGLRASPGRTSAAPSAERPMGDGRASPGAKKNKREKSRLLPGWFYSGIVIILLVVLLILLIVLFRSW
jgi:hypothetical protein